MTDSLSPFPALNWRELHAWTVLAQQALSTGGTIDRVIVPERPRAPGGFLKGEWCLRIQGRRTDWVLTFSVRAKVPYVTLLEGKGPKAAPEGTRSPFDLALSKKIRGTRILGLEALPAERMLILWLAHPEDSALKMGLSFLLIPARPEAALIQARLDSPSGPWQVIASSKVGSETITGRLLTPPDGSRAPRDLPVRQEGLRSLAEHRAHVEAWLEREAFEARLRIAEREVKLRLKQCEERYQQSSSAAAAAEVEPDWQRFGILLQAILHENPRPSASTDGKLSWQLTDGEQIVQAPADPKLNAVGQSERYFQLSKRKQRRIQEGSERARGFSEKKSRLAQALQNFPRFPDWAALERFEREAGLSLKWTAPGARGGKDKHARSGWLGREFISKDGQPIWVGKTRDENLELTFKHARGNDLWMHLRGRPGAHVVIPLHSGKSASLETLLDAAALTVHFSGGSNWGKTDVDYTFKKHVKRIKDSTEASYTHNKTLIVAPDPERLKRLLG